VRRKMRCALDIVEVRQFHIEGNKNDSYKFSLDGCAAFGLLALAPGEQGA
jgi:hypothetical protein